PPSESRITSVSTSSGAMCQPQYRRIAALAPARRGATRGSLAATRPLDLAANVSASSRGGVSATGVAPPSGGLMDQDFLSALSAVTVRALFLAPRALASTGVTLLP